MWRHHRKPRGTDPPDSHSSAEMQEMLDAFAGKKIDEKDTLLVLAAFWLHGWKTRHMLTREQQDEIFDQQ